MEKAKAVRAALLAALLLLSVPGAPRADQDDPRLPALFAELRQADNDTVARHAEAEIWTIWLEVEDPAADALLQQGLLLMSAGRHREALEAFDALVRLKPDFAEGWNKRATLFYLLGDYRRSLLDIDETLRREPRHFGALSGRGLVLQALGKTEAAIAAYEEVLEIYPLALGARMNLELLRREQGRRI